MATFKVMSFLALLVVVVLLPNTAFGFLDDHDLSPALGPFFEKVCEHVNCGKGTCKANSSYPFSYKCECQPGWKRNIDNDLVDDDDLMFLPCIVPNCTLNYGTCQPAPPPMPEIEVPHNIPSAFDPCSWIYCGEGKCTQTSVFKHTCECNSGFSNLLNISCFPCYSECTLGSDCASLGIAPSQSSRESRLSNTGTNTGNGTSESQATSVLLGKFNWMTILIISAGMAIWK